MISVEEYEADSNGLHKDGAVVVKGLLDDDQWELTVLDAFDITGINQQLHLIQGRDAENRGTFTSNVTISGMYRQGWESLHGKWNEITPRGAQKREGITVSMQTKLCHLAGH